MRALLPRSTTAAALLCGHRTRAVHGSFIFQTQQNRSQIHLQKMKALFSSSVKQDQVASRVALLQFSVDSDKKVNLMTASQILDEAARKGASLVVLPEIWNGPYATSAFPDYSEELPNVGDEIGSGAMDDICPSFELLRRKAIEHNLYVIGGSISERVKTESDDLIFNTCLCFSPSGELLAKHRKVHLFDIDVPGGIRFKESDTLTGGTTVSTFDAGEIFGRIGIGICYDIRFPELAMCMIKRGCRILIYPGAFNMTTGKAHWELLQRARAVDGQCYVLTASPARTDPPKEEGKYPHYTAWGHSSVISPWGEVVATCDEKPSIVIADLDMAKVDEMRQGIPTSNQKRLDLYGLDDKTA